MAEHQQRYVAIHPPIIALGLAVLLLEVVLVTTRLRAIPETERSCALPPGLPHT